MSWLVADPGFGRFLSVLLWLALMYSGYNRALYISLAEVMPVAVRAAGFSLPSPWAPRCSAASPPPG